MERSGESVNPTAQISLANGSYFLRSEKPMKISDLIDDCLQNIIERLTLEDLINVAQSNFVLKVAACSVFKRRYGNSVIIFTYPPEIYVENRVLKGITSMKEILRIFGSSITKMYLHYDLHVHKDDSLLEDAIFKSCVECVKEIHISNCHSGMMKGLTKIFSNVTKIELRHGQLSTEISVFHKLFPKIEQLSLSAKFSPECVMKHFPTLTVLKLESSILSIESLRIAISLNPQLRILKLDSNASNMQLDKKILEFISVKLPNLEIFGLTYAANIFTRYEPEVEFKALRKLTLHVGSAEILQYFPLNFSELVELKLVVLRELNYQFLNFLNRVPKIKILTLRVHEAGDFVATSTFMLEFAEMVPNITEIFLQLPISICSTKDLIQFIGKCESLQKVYIKRVPNDFQSIANWESVRDNRKTVGHELLLIKNDYFSKRAENNHQPIILSDGGSRMLITTKYLLSFLSNSRSLHIDTTYQVIGQQKVLVFGTTDVGGRFTPVGLAMTINDEVPDYEFVFRSIKELLTFDYKPEKLIYIANPAIQMAAQIVFGSATLICMCTCFVKKSVYNRITQDSNIKENDRREMMAEFDKLQLAASDDSFNDAIKAFIFKWNQYPKFMDYFERKWVIENPNWRNSFQQVTSNNGLESLCRSMKRLDSIQKIERCVQNWSISSSFF